jgi:hypothetical protein
VILFAYYTWSNSRTAHVRPATQCDVSSSGEDLSDVTDRRDPNFKYVY